MTAPLAGQVALVTGGASGIGRATVRALAEQGATVAVLDIGVHSGADAGVHSGADAGVHGGADVDVHSGDGADLFIRTDVTVEDDVARAVAEVVDRAGGLDIVVGCAGVSGPFGRRVTEVSVDEWDRVLAVNVRGQFLTAKHSIPALRRRGGGTMVLVGSDSSFVAAPGMAAYCASKGAVLMLARALSVDHAPDHIRVNCVCPSIVDTPMSRTDLGLTADEPFRLPGGDPGGTDRQVHTAEEIAALILFLCTPASRMLNGTALVADFGGLARSNHPA